MSCQVKMGQLRPTLPDGCKWNVDIKSILTQVLKQKTKCEKPTQYAC